MFLHADTISLGSKRKEGVNEVVRKSNILEGKRNAESCVAVVNFPSFCKQLTSTNMAAVYQVMSSLY